MKKFIAVLAIAFAVVSCNDAGTGTGGKNDSIDSSANVQKDAVQNEADSMKNNIDSMASNKKDSVATVDSVKSKM